ncbi:MAG: D-cysteine desulfhydrase family protein [Gammaproteobacteria bacterium]|nr:D-cysteine desulfhydrase family protein [Gammaproteobacteria bacterium]
MLKLTALDTLPRVSLAHLPTPLQPLNRLGAALGGPRIWLKRDDCTGLGTGGNKTRKLEFLLGEAVDQAADVVVTFGAIQSNHARQTAAACASQGLECHLLLARKVPWTDPGYETLGNIQLDGLFGGHIHLLESSEVEGHFESMLSEFRAQNRRPYVIPVGGSNATGALGYADCARELSIQCAEHGIELTDVMHATSSAGTQAGLVAGFAAIGEDVRIHGINVSEPDSSELESVILNLANDVLERVDLEHVVSADAIHVDSRFLGEGYGLPTDETLAAIHQLAELEGVLFDPVYSGKAMSGLLARVRDGEFTDIKDLVFIHTGGIASLPVYNNVLRPSG